MANCQVKCDISSKKTRIGVFLSKEENSFFMSLGYPYGAKDLAEMGSRFNLTGGCAGEMNYLAYPFGGTQGFPWVYKPTAKMVQQTFHQYNLRKSEEMGIGCQWREGAFQEYIFPRYGIDGKNMKNMTPFQKAILKRYNTMHEYNQKIILFAKRAKEIPKSLAHKNLFNQTLSQNFDKLHATQKVKTHKEGNAILTEKN